MANPQTAAHAPDPWAIFDGVPPGKAAVAPVASADDPWADFNGTPVAAPAPVQAGPVLQPGQRTGMLANVAAGAQEGLASLGNIAADPVGQMVVKPAVLLGTGAYNLGARAFGYAPADPMATLRAVDNFRRPSLDEIPEGTGLAGAGAGDRVIAAADRAAGLATPADVVPDGAAQRYARAGTAGAVGMAAFGPTNGLLKTAGTLATGAVSGAGSQLAQDVLPNDLAPGGAILGGIAAPMLPAVGVAGIRGAVGLVTNPLMEYARPALGTGRNALEGAASGQSFTAESGAPLSASRNQVRAAGDRLQGAMQDPVATRQALDAAPPMATTPDGRPAGLTAFQLTRDPGLQGAEQAAASGPAAGDFQARAAAQNDVNVGAIRGIADGADPSALPDAVRRQADETAALHDARVDQVSQRMADDLARIQAQADATRAGLGQRADQALQAIGGDLPAGSDAQVGASLRAPVAAAQRQEGAAASQMYDAVAPDGDLALSVAPYKQAAAALAQEVTPSSAPPPELRARLMNRLATMPDVVPYGEARDIQQQLSQGMRDAKASGDMAEHRRLSILRGGVEDSLSSAAADPWADFNGVPATPAPADGAVGAAAPDVGGNVYTAAAPPELMPNFDADAAARLRAANAKAADNAARFRTAPGVGDILKSGPTAGTFRSGDNAVPSAIVKTGPAGADTAKAYLAAGGSPEALSDAAAFSLRQAAMKDGVLDPAAYAKWAKERQSFLSQIPDAAARFGAAADAAAAARAGGKALDAHLAQAAKVAEHTVNDAAAARAAAIKANQDTVAGKFLGGADPVRQVGTILKSSTAERDAAQLAQLTANDPAAWAGLRRAVADYILRDLKGNAGSATGLETALDGNRLQTFLRNSKPALRHIMDPGDVTALQSVANSLASSGLSKQRGVGLSAAPAPTSILQRFTHELAGMTLGGATGAGIGTALLGPAGGYVGGAMGAAMGKAMQAAREAGIQTTDHLVSQALLNPALMRVLLTKATPQNQVSLTTALGNQLRRVSLVSAVQPGSGQDQQRQRQAAAPAFAVRRNDLSPLASRAASHTGQPVNSLLR